MFEKDPRTFSPEYKKLSPEQKAMVKLEITLTNFFRQFDRSVTRWERMVYPALIIFGLLGLSGFYLIFNVTKDMHSMAQHMDPQMESNLDAMSRHMAQLSKNIGTMTGQINTLVTEIHAMKTNIAHMDGQISEITTSIDHVKDSMDIMTNNVAAMTENVITMTGSVDAMSTDLSEMNHSTKIMTGNMSLMSQDMRVMNNNVSRPMNMMNTFAPW